MIFFSLLNGNLDDLQRIPLQRMIFVIIVKKTLRIRLYNSNCHKVITFLAF